MKAFLALATLVSFICANSAVVVFQSEGAKAVSKKYEIEIEGSRNGDTVTKFLETYISARSKPNGWETRMDPGTGGLYYVSSTKLSSQGDWASEKMKNDTIVTEYFVLDRTVLSLKGNPVSSVEGITYTELPTALNATHLAAVERGLKELLSVAKDLTPVMKGKLSWYNNNPAKGNVQVAASVVKGNITKAGGEFKADLGDFLLVAAYVG